MLCKPSTTSRICITVQNSLNSPRDQLRLCKHVKNALLLKYRTSNDKTNARFRSSRENLTDLCIQLHLSSYKFNFCRESNLLLMPMLIVIEVFITNPLAASSSTRSNGNTLQNKQHSIIALKFIISSKKEIFANHPLPRQSRVS